MARATRATAVRELRQLQNDIIKQAENLNDKIRKYLRLLGATGIDAHTATTEARTRRAPGLLSAVARADPQGRGWPEAMTSR